MFSSKELSSFDAINTKRYRILLFMRYLETGIAKTSYLKYVLGYVALASSDVFIAALLGLWFGIFSFILGYLWYKTDTIKIEKELNNQFNLFVKEMRRVYK